MTIIRTDIFYNTSIDNMIRYKYPFMYNFFYVEFQNLYFDDAVWENTEDEQNNILTIKNDNKNLNLIFSVE